VEISYSKAIYCKGMHNHQGLLKVKNKQVIIMDILDIVDEGYPIEEGKDVYFIDSADLRNYNFFNADLRLANLVGADLRGANLDAADLSGANLTNANLTGVQLTTAWVQVVTDDFASDTSGTSFEWHIPSLRHANLTNANLTDANLVGASLLYADLSGADLSGADLSGTDLSVTDLSDALLTGANLYKTTGLGNLTSDQLASTVSKAPTPTIDLNDADGTLVAYEIVDWSGLSGTAFPETTVTLVSTYADTNTSETYTTTADYYGRWSIDQEDVGELPPDGRFSLSVTATDSDGLVSDAATAALIFDLGTAGRDFDAPTIFLHGSSDSEVLEGSDGNDVISGGDGADLILAGAGDDTIVVGGSQTFSSSYKAVNTSSTKQVGTGDKVTLEGMLRVEDVIDGGADTDTIELGEGNVALFLHDAFSGFHSSVQLSSDSTGEQSKARLENIEKITGSDGNNIIDLTSPDYSLAEQSIEVDGGLGSDIIWGSDADEIIIGGDGDDELFGGAGTNALTGGAGADEFQFTMTSENDSVTDFNAAEGDTLKFFNTGGAIFNRDSVTANSEGDGISIEYSHNNQTLSLNISLGLSSISETDELLGAIEII
jgi:Ca2+-binding RTX toxin-like protein